MARAARPKKLPDQLIVHSCADSSLLWKLAVARHPHRTWPSIGRLEGFPYFGNLAQVLFLSHEFGPQLLEVGLNGH